MVWWRFFRLSMIKYSDGFCALYFAVLNFSLTESTMVSMNHPFFRFILSGLLVLSIVLGLQAQTGKKTGIKGVVVDAATKAPLDFATISLFQATDSAMISGTVADEKGNFFLEAPLGTYYAVIEFIGYDAENLPGFSLSKEHPIHDFGQVPIGAAAQNLDEVVVQAERSTMELSLDKKIFNVGKDLANAGGTAIDILGNVPSVQVDPEGNVRLRGSGNVRILIDGKPSGLVSFKGGAGLQQLQGNQIERVEIITNPSARYEAEGMAGIINIVLKKDTRKGFNGALELVSGYQPNYGLAANLNYRKNKVNFFINYGLAYRIPVLAGNLYQEVYGDTTLISEQETTGDVKTVANTVRGGIDYYFDEKNVLTGYYQYRRTDVFRIRDLVYKDYYNNRNNLFATTNRRQEESEAEPYSETALSYKKTYDRKNQELTADVRYLTYWERSDQTYTQSSLFADGRPNVKDNLLQKSLNDEFENQLLVQADYVHPISKEGKFEMGLRSSFRDMKNDYLVTQEDENGLFQTIPGLDNVFLYNERIHALYGIIGNKVKRFSYQFGLRAELSDIETVLEETKESNPRQYTNLFPSAHLTYDLNTQNALQISYSRRIRRPTYNDLSPYVTLSDQRNFFAGNPDLNPEYTNAFDLGHINYFDKGSITSSVYYRHTNDKVLRIRTVDEQGFSTTLPQNLAFENAFGAEFTCSYKLTKWWKADVNFNFFRAITDGKNLDQSFQADTYSWFARQSSRINLPGSTDIQLRTNYEAPQRTPQGRVKSRAFLDFAVAKEILKGKGTLTLNATDVFNSRFSRSITEGPLFYTYGEFGRRARQINLTFMYRLNQGKNAKSPRSILGQEG